MTALRCK